MKHCLDCGVPLPEESPACKLRCTECAKKRHAIQNAESKRRSRNRTSEAIRKQKASHEKSSTRISDIGKLAKEAGMSYGQYVSKYRV